MRTVSDETVGSIDAAGQLDFVIDSFGRRMLVYVSGKYRDVDESSVDQNIQYAKLVAIELWKMGYAVLCPHTNSQHMGFRGDDNVFLEGDMTMVERSDLVVMLENWETSDGAKLERRLAQRLGIPVYYWSVDQLALQRLAANDDLARDARAAIFGRAARIAEVTKYRPKREHVAAASAAETGSERRASRRQRHAVDGFRAPLERLANSIVAAAKVRSFAAALRKHQLQTD